MISYCRCFGDQCHKDGPVTGRRKEFRMKFFGKFLWISLAFGLFGIVLVKCASDSESPTNFDRRIHLMYAEEGSLSPVNQSATGISTSTGGTSEYILTLENVSEDMLWYKDRPEKESGTENTGYFFQDIWPEVYNELAPNAVLDAWVLPNQPFDDFNDGFFPHSAGTPIRFRFPQGYL